MGEARCTRNGFLPPAEQAFQPLGAALFQPPVDQFEAPPDTGQQIIEIVSHPPGQLPDGVHLAGLVHSLLGAVLCLAVSIQALLQID
ncbi:hypothetical protein D3C79_655300 [compost metagenome]